MPLPLAHALSVLFLYFRGKRFIDPLALLMAATFVDLETVFYIFAGNALDHQIWHGYLLVLTFYPVLIGLTAYIVERALGSKLFHVYSLLGFKPIKAVYPLRVIYLSCLIGGLSHVFFDMFTHESLMYVIYPFHFGNNSFYLGYYSGLVEAAVWSLVAYSIFCWFKSARAAGYFLAKPQNTNKFILK